MIKLLKSFFKHEEEIQLVNKVLESVVFSGNEPIYATPGAAGADLKANNDYIVPAGGSATIETGTFVKLPTGYEGQIRPRSGLTFNRDVDVILGTVDCDFRGEIKVKLRNFSNVAFQVVRGDRVAQIVINKVERLPFVKGEVKNDTERGTQGFGHTGMK